MNILVINGPNINLLGLREPEIYGKESYENLKKLIYDKSKELNINIEIFQSNHEGTIVDKIQESYKIVDGIIINPAAYTHTSIAILDAIKGVGIPSVEVHISDIGKREEYRKISYIGQICIKTIKGKGIAGYIDALEYLVKYLNTNKI